MEAVADPLSGEGVAGASESSLRSGEIAAAEGAQTRG
jgi:predicted carbohydrate-binding protein with CBM5 and CBM33 domain